MKPKFKHDCNRCKFLGHYNDHDLYYCNGESEIEATLIRRYGDEGQEYGSGLVFGADERFAKDDDGNLRPLRVAYLIARELGLDVLQYHEKVHGPRREW